MRVKTEGLKCEAPTGAADPARGGGSRVHKSGFFFWKLITGFSLYEWVTSKANFKRTTTHFRPLSHHCPPASHPSLLWLCQSLTWRKMGQTSSLPLNVLKWTKLLGGCLPSRGGRLDLEQESCLMSRQFGSGPDSRQRREKLYTSIAGCSCFLGVLLSLISTHPSVKNEERLARSYTKAVYRCIFKKNWTQDSWSLILEVDNLSSWNRRWFYDRISTALALLTWIYIAENVRKNLYVGFIFINRLWI